MVILKASHGDLSIITIGEDTIIPKSSKKRNVSHIWVRKMECGKEIMPASIQGGQERYGGIN
jgi:hypothetical protein